MGTRSPPCVARFLRADCSKCDSALAMCAAARHRRGRRARQPAAHGSSPAAPTGRGRTTGRLPGASAVARTPARRSWRAAQLGVQAGDQLHHERRRRCLGRGTGLLANGQRAHVQAAVDELGLHGGERQAVALHRLDDACFERSPIGVAQEGESGRSPWWAVSSSHWPGAGGSNVTAGRAVWVMCSIMVPPWLAIDSIMSANCRQYRKCCHHD